jgi:hypothetical protein
MQREILICQDEDGREDFSDWIASLDVQTRHAFVFASTALKKDSLAMWSRLARVFQN